MTDHDEIVPFGAEPEKANVEKVQEFFGATASTELPKEVMEDPAPKEITEELLERFQAADQAEKLAKAKKEKIRKILIDLAGRRALDEEGKIVLSRGAYVLSIERRSSTRIEWQKYVRALLVDQFGEEAAHKDIDLFEEAIKSRKCDSPYGKVTESVVLEVKKLNQE